MQGWTKEKQLKYPESWERVKKMLQKARIGSKQSDKQKKMMSERMKGNTFGFKKGEGFWTGKKRPEMRDWEGLKKWRETGFKKYQFKKGHQVPEEWREVWREKLKGRINSDKQKRIAKENWLGEKNPRWSGGRYIDKYGYVRIHDDKNRWRPEHRVVAERLLGRELKRSETIHHINEIKNDNRPENLYYYPNDSLHKSYHCRKIKELLKSNLCS